MGKRDNIYDKIQELLGQFAGNLTVAEQSIDTGVQLEYNRFAELVKEDLDPEEILKDKDDLFLENIPVEAKKKLLVQLASIDLIEAFRTLEKFAQNPEDDLTEWAALALQQNRILMESNLMDVNQVLISTGLGGKGMKIRYFTVLITRTGQYFSAFEQKLLASEIRFAITRCKGEIEVIRFDKELCMVISVIPLKVAIHELFDGMIEECNHYDDFLNPDYMITNVKILSGNEIRQMIRKNRVQKNPEK